MHNVQLYPLSLRPVPQKMDNIQINICSVAMFCNTNTRTMSQAAQFYMIAIDIRPIYVDISFNNLPKNGNRACLRNALSLNIT
jgi:hypothetical protein